MSYPPTAEQQAAIDMAKQGKTMKLLAFAGAGKTSTLVFVAEALGALGKKGLYLAFNKDIAKEATRKMPRNVQARTFHSLALSQAPSYIKERLAISFPPWEFNKKFQIEDLLLNAYETEYESRDGKLAGKDKKARNILTAARQKSIVDECLSLFYKTDCEEPEFQHMEEAINNHIKVTPEDAKALSNELLPIAIDMWRDFCDPNGKLGLEGRHDVYLKLWAMSNPVIDTDFILFDEAQDADPIMTGVLEKQKCQVIYVGDPYQQIYSFRGAVNVMQTLAAPQSELTQSFRFGQGLADACLPVLRALGCKNSIKGTPSLKTEVHQSDFSGEGSLDAILCRTNSQAVLTTLEAVKKRAETGKGTLALPLNITFKETKDMMFAIHEMKKKGKCDHPKLKGFSGFEQLKEYAKSYPRDMEISSYVRMYLTIGMKSVLETIESVENIKAHEHKGPFVTTAHRSKGLEWDNVLLAPDMYSVFEDVDVTEPSMLDPDELRLLYVAMTRAKKNLYLGEVRTFLSELKCVYGD